MSNSILLKKIDKNIDNCLKKDTVNFNIDQLIMYVIDKINRSSTNETLIQELETILQKLLQNGFNSVVKTFCFYIISNFNQEFNEQFFTSIANIISSDLTNFDKLDYYINGLRHFVSLNQSDMMSNISTVENFFKTENCDINFIVNSFYFSDFPSLLMKIMFDIPEEDVRQYKVFLTKFYSELGKLVLFNKLEDVTFLNLIQMLSKLLSNFISIPSNDLEEEIENESDPYLSFYHKNKIINSVLIPLSEYLIIHLEEIICLIKTFDNKLLSQSILFPIHLYKIYNYYKDIFKTENKYEENFHVYMQFIFNEIRNVLDPDIFSEITKAICEYKILCSIKINNSTEIIELLSLIISFTENLDKSMWFDNNLKNLSFLINYIDYNKVMDYAFLLLKETYNIKNLNDRIMTLYNLFNRIIYLSINYKYYFENESVILCLFKQEWFVLLVNKSEIDEKESKWRHDLFICLIEAIFNISKFLLKNKNQYNNYINIIQLCQDIIDVCFKILDWKDEGEAYKMYFLILEKTCLFFNEKFYNYLYGKLDIFQKMKIRLDDVLNELSKRFYNQKWDNLMYANENSKYNSLLILCKYLNPEKNKDLKNLLDTIISHIRQINFEIQEQNKIEKLLLCLLFLGLRINPELKETLIKELKNYIEYLNLKMNEGDIQLIGNVLSLTENILYYLLEHKNDPPTILDSKAVDQLTNEFYLIVSKEIDMNAEIKSTTYNTLYLMNLTENSFNIFDAYSKLNSSIYLDYFRKLYYYPILEYNNDSSHILIPHDKKFITSDYKLITGISDPIHIYYRYIIDIENRNIDIYIKNYNTTNFVLSNVIFNVYLNVNLILNNTKNNNNQSYKVFKNELLAPYSTYEFNIKCFSKIFDSNNILIETQFDLNYDQKSQFFLKTEPLYIPLTEFLIPDNYALYETDKFEIFCSTLEYAFTTKCYTNCSPIDIIKSLSDKVSLIEYKSNNFNFKKQNEILEQIIKEKYNDFNREEKKIMNVSEGKRENFKIKIATYCVYNFWIYMFIIGDYNSMYNKAILNIDIKTNDLKALSVIAKEKQFIIKELISDKIKFY